MKKADFSGCDLSSLKDFAVNSQLVAKGSFVRGRQFVYKGQTASYNQIVQRVYELVQPGNLNKQDRENVETLCLWLYQYRDVRCRLLGPIDKLIWAVTSRLFGRKRKSEVILNAYKDMELFQLCYELGIEADALSIRTEDIYKNLCALSDIKLLLPGERTVALLSHKGRQLVDALSKSKKNERANLKKELQWIVKSLLLLHLAGISVSSESDKVLVNYKSESICEDYVKPLKAFLSVQEQREVVDGVLEKGKTGILKHHVQTLEEQGFLSGSSTLRSLFALRSERGMAPPKKLVPFL